MEQFYCYEIEFNRIGYKSKISIIIRQFIPPFTSNAEI